MQVKDITTETSTFGEKISNMIKVSFEEVSNRIEALEKEKELLESRAKVAESLVTEIKTSANNEIQKAYKKGYEEGLKNSAQFSNPEGGPKLVYKQN